MDQASENRSIRICSIKKGAGSHQLLKMHIQKKIMKYDLTLYSDFSRRDKILTGYFKHIKSGT